MAVSVEVLEPDGTTRRVTDRSDVFWSQVRVFDKDFVKRNLLFDVGGRSEALPLLVLGEPNVDRDKRLARIDERLAEIDGELPEARGEQKRGQETARKLETDTARTISQELQAAGGRFAARSYNATKVREDRHPMHAEPSRSNRCQVRFESTPVHPVDRAVRGSMCSRIPGRVPSRSLDAAWRFGRGASPRLAEAAHEPA